MSSASYSGRRYDEFLLRNYRPYSCSNCLKAYKDRNTLQDHIRYICGKEPSHFCPFCPFKSRLRGNLKKHIIHNFGELFNEDSQRLFNCPKCQKTYKHKSALREHLLYTCGKAPAFSCPHCTHRTHLPGNLKKHILRRHFELSMPSATIIPTTSSIWK
ncbi:zinc finger protein 786-like [Chrysoperla carnea]|uniref:zinc finger protein 786-like n=1 Tax=Chrysoperla carnea TaxID=189513 RepID=UPI001D05F036|nr:zinc finger protein 786-like [Chrysoperla carnea]